jgi:hypothetical protein
LLSQLKGSSSDPTVLETVCQATKVTSTKDAKSTFVDFKKLHQPAKAGFALFVAAVSTAEGSGFRNCQVVRYF